MMGRPLCGCIGEGCVEGCLLEVYISPIVSMDGRNYIF